MLFQTYLTLKIQKNHKFSARCVFFVNLNYVWICNFFPHFWCFCILSACAFIRTYSSQFYLVKSNHIHICKRFHHELKICVHFAPTPDEFGENNEISKISKTKYRMLFVSINHKHCIRCKTREPRRKTLVFWQFFIINLS